MSVPHLLALHRGLNLTLNRFQRLHDYFKHDWEKAFMAKINDWQAAGIDKKGLEKWFGNPKPSPEKEWEQVKQAGAQVLVYGEDDYPLPLQHTPQAPALLFVRGDIQADMWPSLAVVGSRQMTPYGEQTLDHMVGPVAQAGIPIISGLAYGIDAAAHQLALKHHCPTIAVLGCGIDQIYPQHHRQLARQIAQNGAIISELLPGTQARPEYFPARNRIIAGLSQATLVVEAATKSGSLITAQFAADFGREVMTIPGDVFSKGSGGPHRLLRDGAQLISNSDDILKTLGYDQSRSIKIELPTDPLACTIIKAMQPGQKQHLDDLIRQHSAPGPRVTAAVTLLEMQGWLRHCGGGMYRRVI